MKKTILLFTLAAFSLSALTQIATPPVIDGDGSDASWASAIPLDVNKQVSVDDRTGDSDISGTLYLLWDTDFLYAKVEITDDILDSSVTIAGKDHVRLDIDLDNSKPEGYRSGDSLQFYFEHFIADAGNWGYREGYNNPANEWDGWVTPRFNYKDHGADSVNGTTYVYEVRIPAAGTYGFPLFADALVGVDIKIADHDGDDDKGDQLTWNQAADQGWHNPDFLGTVKLLADGSVEPVRVLPVIDGVKDYTWNAAFKWPVSKHISKDDRTGNNDISGNAYVLWDSDFLYIMTDITDDILDSSVTIAGKDHVRLDIDLDNSKPEGYRSGDSLQFYFEHFIADAGNWGYREGYNNPANEWDGWVTPRFNYKDHGADSVNGTKYLYEARIPAADVYGFPLVADALVGFDIKIADHDNDDDKGDQLTWNQAADQGWHNPDFLGTIKLMADGSVVPVRVLPVIDGVKEYAWNAAQTVDIAKHGTVDDRTGNSDVSGKASMLWDANYLYIKVEVTDDILDSSATIEGKDHVRIDVDLDNSDPEQYRSGDSLQFYIEHFIADTGNWGYREGYNNPANEWSGWVAPRFSYKDHGAESVNGTKYLYEVRIPSADVYGFPLSQGLSVGIDFKVADHDGDDKIGDQMFWNQGDDLGWHHPDILGTVKLQSDGFVEFLPVMDGDASLDTLSVDMGTLAPVFHPDSLNYKLILATAVDSVTITATASSEKSTLTIDNAVPPPGTAKIEVIAEDRKTLVYRIVITVDDEVAIPEREADADIAVYPNPSTYQLTISTQEDIQSIQIISIIGALVKESSQKVIDISDLDPGLYMIKINTTKKTQTTRFVKE